MENEKVETQTNEVQNNKPNKKGKGVIVLLVIVILALGGCLAYVLLNNNTTTNTSSNNTNVTENNTKKEKKGLFNIFKKKDKENKDDKDEYKVNLSSNTVIEENPRKYTYEKESLSEGNIDFYKDGKKVRTWDCKGMKCALVPFKEVSERSDTPGVSNKYIVGDQVVIATCSDKNCSPLDTLFYDATAHEYTTGTIILFDIWGGGYGMYTDVEQYYVNEYFVYLKYADGTIKVVSYDSRVSRELKEDELTYICYEGCGLTNYDYREDRLVFKKGEKYGIQKFSDGTVVLEPTYEEVKLLDSFDDISNIVCKDNEGCRYSSKYFKAKKDGLYNLYDIKNMTQVTKQGYDGIWVLADNVLLTYKDKKFSIKNLSEKELISEKINVEKIYATMPHNPTGVAINKQNDETISISIGVADILTEKDSSKWWLNYTYNLKTKSLTKKEN